MNSRVTWAIRSAQRLGRVEYHQANTTAIGRMKITAAGPWDRWYARRRAMLMLIAIVLFAGPSAAKTYPTTNTSSNNGLIRLVAMTIGRLSGVNASALVAACF